MKHAKPTASVAALFVSGRSIYKHLPGVVAFDRHNDPRAKSLDSLPIVAHPPCRLWSRTLKHQAALSLTPAQREDERNLGRWAVEQVKKHGGVLEQPAHSALWADCGLPLPNQPGEPLLYSLYLEQSWFGHPCRKKTWILVSRVPRRSIPALPFSLVQPSPDQFSRLNVFQRSRTMTRLAEWLCQVARLVE
jgi:hypothetical protein